jgi:hypothetical protein
MKSLVPLAAAVLMGGLLAPVSVGAPPAPILSATPTTVDFGSLTKGDTASRTITVTNTGRTPVVVGGWGVIGIPFGLGDELPCSSLVVRPGRGFLLLPGRSCTFTVIALTYNFGPSGINYHPPGTYAGAFVVWGVDQADELVHVPMTVTIVWPS